MEQFCYSGQRRAGLLSERMHTNVVLSDAKSERHEFEPKDVEGMKRVQGIFGESSGVDTILMFATTRPALISGEVPCSGRYARNHPCVSREVRTNRVWPFRSWLPATTSHGPSTVNTIHSAGILGLVPLFQDWRKNPAGATSGSQGPTARV